MAKHHPVVGSAPVEATELELQDLFAQEVLQSERLRATILAWTFGAAAIYVTLNLFLVHVLDLPVVEAGFPFATIIIFLAGVTLYEIAAWKFVARRLEQGRDVQPWVWYANAFIEVSLPTLVLVFIGQTLGMVLARLSPVVLFYFEIEEIALKGMPLGSVSEFPYQKQELTLFPGDAVVLMSDGFPERFNERGEILDYEKAKAILIKVAHQSPNEIIEHFVEVGEAWAEGRAQDDDVTFVVLKVKNTITRRNYA